MSNYKLKTSNKELSSIYRMDFYKKKKNWKFTSDMKKEASKPEVPEIEESIKSKLNLTYDVDPQECDSPKELNDLNDAFIEIDSAEIQSELLDSEKHSAEIQLELLDSEKHETPPYDGLSPDWPESMPPSSDVKDTDNMDLKQTQIFVNSRYIPPENQTFACYAIPLQQDYIYPMAGDDFGPQYSYLNSGPQNFSPEFDQAQWPQQFMDYGEDVIDKATYQNLDKSTNSIESLTDFIRGAHCVPHSSEIELNVPDVPQSELSTECLAQLPSKVLHSLLQQHRRVMQALLKEAGARVRVQPKSLSLENCQYYTSYIDISNEIPTRDIGSYACSDIGQISTQGDDFQPDCFLAGSTQISRGRGRGRLMENTQLFGVGRGRNRQLNSFFSN